MNHAVNWEAISAIGQIVGAIAVVISLIYLAREVGRNARETRRAAMRSTLDSVTGLSQQIATHADLAELRQRGWDDFESLEGTDLARFHSYMHSVFRTAEDAYYQHLEGHFDPHIWRGLEATLREVNARPGVQAWWRSCSHCFGGEEFAEFINQQQQTTARRNDSSQHIYEVRPRKDHRGVVQKQNFTRSWRNMRNIYDSADSGIAVMALAIIWSTALRCTGGCRRELLSLPSCDEV